MGCIYLLLFVIQLFIILYNITLYRYGLNNHLNHSKLNKLYIDVNEMDDEWGQFVNIEMI